MNILAERPMAFRKNGKMYPLKNMKINADDVFIANDISRIYNERDNQSIIQNGRGKTTEFTLPLLDIFQPIIMLE